MLLVSIHAIQSKKKAIFFSLSEPDVNAAAWEAEKAMNAIDVDLRSKYENIIAKKEENNSKKNQTVVEKMSQFVHDKYKDFRRRYIAAVNSFAIGQTSIT